MKKRKLLVGGILLAVLLVVGGGIYLIGIKKDSNKNNDDGTSEKADYNPALLKSVDSFDDIQALYNKGDYESVVERAKTYAGNTENQPTLRLMAYGICIDSARQVNNKGIGDECYEKGKAYANTLSSDLKDPWLERFENARNGVPTNEDSNDNSYE